MHILYVNIVLSHGLGEKGTLGRIVALPQTLPTDDPMDIDKDCNRHKEDVPFPLSVLT